MRKIQILKVGQWCFLVSLIFILVACSSVRHQNFSKRKFLDLHAKNHFNESQKILESKTHKFVEIEKENLVADITNTHASTPEGNVSNDETLVHEVSTNRKLNRIVQRNQSEKSILVSVFPTDHKVRVGNKITRKSYNLTALMLAAGLLLGMSYAFRKSNQWMKIAHWGMKNPKRARAILVLIQAGLGIAVFQAGRQLFDLGFTNSPWMAPVLMCVLFAGFALGMLKRKKRRGIHSFLSNKLALSTAVISSSLLLMNYGNSWQADKQNDQSQRTVQSINEAANNSESLGGNFNFTDSNPESTDAIVAKAVITALIILTAVVCIIFIVAFSCGIMCVGYADMGLLFLLIGLVGTLTLMAIWLIINWLFRQNWDSKSKTEKVLNGAGVGGLILASIGTILPIVALTQPIFNNTTFNEEDLLVVMRLTLFSITGGLFVYMIAAIIGTIIKELREESAGNE